MIKADTDGRREKRCQDLQKRVLQLTLKSG